MLLVKSFSEVLSICFLNSSLVSWVVSRTSFLSFSALIFSCRFFLYSSRSEFCSGSEVLVSTVFLGGSGCAALAGVTTCAYVLVSIIASMVAFMFLMSFAISVMRSVCIGWVVFLDNFLHLSNDFFQETHNLCFHGLARYLDVHFPE